VVRFDLYPTSQPQYWCVGFNISARSNESVNMFIDNIVPISVYCNNTLCQNIVEAVWELVKESVCNWAVSKLNTIDVLDTLYVPSSV